MSENLCIRCARPMADQAYCCSNCAYRAGDQLHEIADLCPPARDVAHGFTRHGDSSASGKPGSRMPLNTMATQKLDQIQARLSTWVGEIAHGRGRPIPAPRHLGDDPIVLWARWLAGHVEWMRKTDDAERFLIEVDECVRVIRGVVRGPAPQKYLGPCGAVVEPPECNPIRHAPDCPQDCGIAYPCDGDVYAREGASDGACRVCGAKWSTGERAVWLDGVARSWLYHANEIADAYPIKAATIRAWLSRGLLVAHGEHDGRPLLKLGDVLDLAAGDAARREEARATRARRTAAKAVDASTVTL